MSNLLWRVRGENQVTLLDDLARRWTRMFGGPRLRAHSQRSCEVLQSCNPGERGQLRRPRIRFRGNVFDRHRETAKFAPDANLVNVFTSAWDGHNANPN